MKPEQYDDECTIEALTIRLQVVNRKGNQITKQISIWRQFGWRQWVPPDVQCSVEIIDQHGEPLLSAQVPRTRPKKLLTSGQPQEAGIPIEHKCAHSGRARFSK